MPMARPPVWVKLLSLVEPNKNDGCWTRGELELNKWEFYYNTTFSLSSHDLLEDGRTKHSYLRRIKNESLFPLDFEAEKCFVMSWVELIFQRLYHTKEFDNTLPLFADTQRKLQPGKYIIRPTASWDTFCSYHSSTGMSYCWYRTKQTTAKCFLFVQ